MTKVSYVAEYNDGTCVCDEKFDKDKVVKFTIKFNDIQAVVELDGEKELIFFKRYIRELGTNILENIIYFVGYKKNNEDYILSFDSSAAVCKYNIA